jgi:glycosyltransferase involved in cell wall biosynthesis
MYNFWFAIEDHVSLLSLKKGVERSEVNAIWFPVAALQSGHPFNNLTPALSRALRRGRVDALFYQSQSRPLPPASLTHRLPTVVSLDCYPCENDEKVNPAGYVVWSEWARAEAIKSFKVEPGRVLVARSGVDLSGWDASLNNFERARANKTGLPAKVRLLFIADDFVGLGGEVLLDIMRHNPRLADSCEVHIVVNRSTASTYLKPAFLPRNVQVYTYGQPRHEPTELYAQADICVLPSQKPVSPSLIAKAMAAGLPVVATRLGGLPELVRDGQSGVLVEKGDTVGLVQALMALIDDPARRQELGEGARRVAEAEFDAAANAHKILTFMKQLTAEARAGSGQPARDLPYFPMAAIRPDAHPYFEE